MTTRMAPTGHRLFDDEHEAFRDSFRTFLEREVRPHAAAWDAEGRPPRSLYADMARHGFVAMAVPEDHGGPGVEDFRCNVVLNEEAQRAGLASHVAGPLLVTDICLPYLLRGACAGQRARWLPDLAAGRAIWAIAMTEPGTGSDLQGIATHARRDGDHYVLQGQKTFITNGASADKIIVAARTGQERGGRSLTLFVVDGQADGLTRGPQIDKVGQHASDTAELFLSDVRVPVADRLGEEGSGFAQLVDKLVPERLIIAVGALAAAEAALERTLDYVKGRSAFGRPIGTFQHSRFTLAELQTELVVGRAFIEQCVERHVAGELDATGAAMAKWWTTELLGRVTDRCLQLHGGYGYTEEYDISRRWVDARVTRIYGGTTEIMKEIIGRSMGLA